MSYNKDKIKVRSKGDKKMERKRIISAAEAVEMYREEERRKKADKAAEEFGKIVGKFVGRVIGITINCVIVYALWKTFGC